MILRELRVTVSSPSGKVARREVTYTALFEDGEQRLHQVERTHSIFEDIMADRASQAWTTSLTIRDLLFHGLDAVKSVPALQEALLSPREMSV